MGSTRAHDYVGLVIRMEFKLKADNDHF